MESLTIGDSVTDRIVKQLNQDYESIQETLEFYQAERMKTVNAQNMALASYDAEIREIEGANDPTERFYIYTSDNMFVVDFCLCCLFLISVILRTMWIITFFAI